MIILSIFTPPKKIIPNEAKQHQPLRVVEAESVTQHSQTEQCKHLCVLY